jgi:hypothetical protein
MRRIVIILLVLMLLIGLVGFGKVKSYENEYISKAQELVSEYNLNDANIGFEYNGKNHGYRTYDLVVESLEFQNIDDNKKFNFVKSLDNIRVSDAEFLVLSSTVSNKDVYKIDVTNDNVLNKNGSEYYSKNNTPTKSTTNSSSSTYSSKVTSLTSDQKIEAWVAAEYYVRNRLKSPSSADFPRYSENYVTVQDGKIVVVAWVDAQNSFGATLRNTFIVVMDGDYKLLDIAID